ncbi:MBL fold metallo-hydrolase [Candidatus Microgenomates bacterium]|nr:MBL fold metallo-hydrolase [Candidatus Microgenomates bacterium]
MEGVKEVHLFLSHYHLDHAIGFYGAFQLLKGKRVTVYAESGRQVFWEFVKLKHFPIDYTKAHRNFTWKALKEGSYDFSSYKVSIIKQRHRDETSLSFRFTFPKTDLVYATDGEPTKKVIEFARGTKLLLHEHGFTGEALLKKKLDLEKHVLDGHVTTIGAAMIAKSARVGKLVLIHHEPFVDKEQLGKQLKVAKKIFPKTELAMDLEEITF